MPKKKFTPEDNEHFLLYVRLWRRILIDVLDWPESRFTRFVLRKELQLRRAEKEFFQRSPLEYVAKETVPKKLKNMLQGSSGFGYGLIDAIVGETKTNQGLLARSGILGGISAGYVNKICSPRFDLEKARQRYQRQVERLAKVQRRSSQEDLKDFARYEEFWRIILVEVLEWQSSDFTQFVSLQRSRLRDQGSGMFFHSPPDKYILPKLLPMSLQSRITGIDAILAARSLMSAIMGNSSPDMIACDAGLDIQAAKSRYLRAVRRLERK